MMMDQLRNNPRERRDLLVAEVPFLELARRDPARARDLGVIMELCVVRDAVEEERGGLEVSAFDVVVRDFH